MKYYWFPSGNDAGATLARKPEVLDKPDARSALQDEAISRLAKEFHDACEGVDHLGRAAASGRQAEQAVSERGYDDAWILVHEQQQHYMGHAASFGLSIQETLELQGSTHLTLANIRRLQRSHDDALVHMIYAQAASRRPAKEPISKLRVFFSRCRFSRATLEDVLMFVEHQRICPNIVVIQARVAEWRAAEKEQTRFGQWRLG